ncbi:initiation control protein YabA [Facklamia sp. P13069]|uniref:initiation control protein YabA n=1 Tax=Facklamia sp. P13069 TaxID=3421954 RepID=UPI003D169F7F
MSEIKIEELLMQVNQELNQLFETVNTLSEEVTRLTNENNRLRMQQYQAVEQIEIKPLKDEENQKNQVIDKSEQTLEHRQSGQARLQAFYNEGIHICHHYFGSKRETNEECIFCQDIIDSLGEQ